MELDKKYRWFAITLKDSSYRPKEYIFRAITRREFLASRTYENEFAQQEYFLKTCVANYVGDELQGTCERIISEIVKLSGIDGDDLTLVSELQAWMDDEEGVNEAIAIIMINGITPDYLDNADPVDRLKCLLLGRKMFQVFTMQTGVTMEDLFPALEKKVENDFTVGL